MEFFKPIIFVSECLNFRACRYDGQKLRNNLVKDLEKFCVIKKVCPETSIGLGVPRLPIRLMNKGGKLVLEEIKTENDYTEKMTDFSKKYVDSLKEVDGFILKSKSPSCGIGGVKIHNGSSGLEKIENLKSGLFAKQIIKSFPASPKEDEGRLLNYHIREEFLTKIFLKAYFRNIINLELKDLLKFQSKNKYLFMSYSPSLLKQMGKILANSEGKKLEEIKKEYIILFEKILQKNINKGGFVNTVEHIYGYFKDKITKDEKDFFFATLEMYKEGRTPSHSVIFLLKMWSERFDLEYLREQNFLYPYPAELIDLSDSGKKITI